MIPDLEVTRKYDWRHLVAGENLGFSFSLAKDEVAAKTKTDVQSKRFMFTIMSTPARFTGAWP
jgi:hypothetical protein